MKCVHWILAGVIAIGAVAVSMTSVTADARMRSSETGAELVLLSREKAEQIREKLEELSDDLRNDTEWQDEISGRVQEKMEQALAEVREIYEGIGRDEEEMDGSYELAGRTELYELTRELTFDPELMGLVSIALLANTAEFESAPKAELLEKALAKTKSLGLRNSIRLGLMELYRDNDQVEKCVETAMAMLAENDKAIAEEDENSDDSDDEEDTEDH